MHVDHYHIFHEIINATVVKFEIQVLLDILASDTATPIKSLFAQITQFTCSTDKKYGLHPKWHMGETHLGWNRAY